MEAIQLVATHQRTESTCFEDPLAEKGKTWKVAQVRQWHLPQPHLDRDLWLSSAVDELQSSSSTLRRSWTLSHVSSLCTETVDGLRLHGSFSTTVTNHCESHTRSSLSPHKTTWKVYPLQIHIILHPSNVCAHLFEPTELCTFFHVFPTAAPQINSFCWYAMCICVCTEKLFFCPYIFPRDCVYFALCETFGCHVVTDAGLLFWRIRMVLWSPKSLNFSAFSWMKSGFVDSLWVVSFTIIVAVF